jgi:pyruvate dehydrogenase E1 component alpha subunit
VERARAGDGPTLIECVTYRLSMHTTSDDPTKYRSVEEVEAWERKDPLTRFGAYLQQRNLVEPGLDEAIDAEIARAVEAFEAVGAPDPLVMFDHAYATRSAALEGQRAEMAARQAQAPAAAASAARRADDEDAVAPELQSPPMRGQRRPWRS